MSRDELISALKWGKAAIKSYKESGKTVPDWVYQRQIELEEQLIELCGISLE